MLLKSIDLFGFKSFADKSHIEFTEGISALLGPNGCGKSNVVDAVKWVLGEQSTRTLRADKMEDVIFNGTESRKALSVAEVTLVLSNDSGLLPIDVSELSVRRRLYRSGESEYAINNKPARLREVRELFYDTGIGKSAYSIMEQGKIDQVLSNKPEERRYIFEEAAGITKFKARGAEAERKLARTEDNMHQVENILREVQRSYDTLKSQAEKTGVYRDLRERVFQNELKIHLLRLRGFLESEERKQDQLDGRTRERDQIRGKIDEINEALETDLDTVNRMESDLIERQKRLYEAELERNNCDSQIQVQKERSEETKRYLSRRRERAEAVTEAIRGIDEQVTERKAAVAELSERLLEVRANIEAFETNLKTAQERISQNDDSISAREQDIREQEKVQQQLQRDLRELYDDIVTQLDTKLVDSGYTHKRRTEAEDALRSSVRALAIHLDGRIEIVNDALNVGTTDRSTSESVAQSCLEVLRECARDLDEIGTKLDTFCRSIPAFIDEFIAPEGIITKKRAIDTDLETVAARIENNRKEAERLRTENKHLRNKIEEYRKTLEELRVGQERTKTQKASAEEAVKLLMRQRSDHEAQLEESKREIERAQEQIRSIEKTVSETAERKSKLTAKIQGMEKALRDLEQSIASRNSSVVSEEKRMKALMSKQQTLQGQIEKLQMELSSIRADVRNLYENFADRYSRDLHEYESDMMEINTPIGDYRSALANVREKLKELGQVNLMAPEEFEEVKERYEFLTTQMEDLKKAREDLKVVTEQIRTESTEQFLDTYEKIKKNFHVMFRRLFGGGRAELSLTEPDEVLTSGVDIRAQPPGKKLESIDLLSGGEKSLTAVALLFATYMVRPSPFCILDEIDAALDEENVGRFVNLLKEFSKSSQFIVITHNKRTVANAESLLGVTMEESGVSTVIAVRLGNRETVEA